MQCKTDIAIISEDGENYSNEYEAFLTFVA